MENFDNIKNIWNSEKAENIPQLSEINHEMLKYKAKTKQSLHFWFYLLLLSAALMFCVLVFNKTEMVSTIVGEIMIILTISYVIYNYIKIIVQKRVNDIISNNDYLSLLKQEKINDLRLKKKSQAISFLLLFLSYGIFLHEIISESTKTLVIGYSIYMAIMAVLWFIYKPYWDKKQKKANQILIDKIENLKNQIDDEN